MHETRIKIRPSQLDTFGHLNNAAYLEVYEWARWEWADAAGLAGRDLVERATGRADGQRAVGPAILRIEIDFRREIQLHEVVTVQTRFESIQGIKGVLRQAMVREDGVLASEARILFVMFDLRRRKAVPMPPEMVRLCEADGGSTVEAGVSP